jgi:hypothetical protein
MVVKNIEIPTEKIANFCQRWKIIDVLEAARLLQTFV